MHTDLASFFINQCTWNPGLDCELLNPKWKHKLAKTHETNKRSIIIWGHERTLRWWKMTSSNKWIWKPSLEYLTAVVGVKLIIAMCVEMSRRSGVPQCYLNISMCDWSNHWQLCMVRDTLLLQCTNCKQ